MPSTPGDILRRHLRKLLAVPSARDLPDQQLLERFLQQQDEVAFEALVRRHGPLVFGVCRRVLRHEQDAEDAFQATFLVLAQKAASVRKLGSVSSWLYGVAARIAAKAKVNAGKRRRHEHRAANLIAAESGEDTSMREFLSVLDEELQRLPEKYRAPLVLCYLEGKTQEEAARELAWSAGSVKGRLERGRDALRVRLSRRGITLPAALLTTLLARKITVQAALLNTTVPTATLMMAGQADSALISTQVARLAAGAMRAMLLTKVKVGAAVLLVASVAAAGTGILVRTAFADKQTQEQPPTGVAKTTNRPEPAKAEPASPTGPTFHGTVRFQGRAVPDATAWLVSSSGPEQAELAKTQADDQGRFVLPVKPGARWIVARDAQGHLGWFETYMGQELTSEPDLRVELYDMGEVHGRLTGPAGESLRGRIRIYAVSPPSSVVIDERNGPRALSIPAPLAKELETALGDDGSFVIRGIPAHSKVSAVLTAPAYDGLCIWWDQEQPLELRLEKPGEARVHFTGATDPTQLAGLSFRLERQSQPEQAMGWRLFLVRQVKADSKGTLVMKDLYPGIYSLSPEQNTDVPWEAEKPASFKIQQASWSDVAVAVKPKAKIQGRIIDRVSGKGVPDVGINVYAITEQRSSEYGGYFRTGSDGRFTGYTRPGKLSLSFSAPAGYLLPEGFSETHTVAAGDSFAFPDIALEPAVPVEGVVQDSTGRPIPGILVRTVPAPPPFEAPLGKNAIYSDAAGRFTLRGLGPRNFAALRARTAKAVTRGGIPIDGAKQGGPIRLVLSEADAFRLRGRVRDNAGQPVEDAAVRLVWRYKEVGRGGSIFTDQQLETYRTDADGRFETQALWPGDHYNVKVTAADHGPGESPWVIGEAGRVLDLGTITLARTAGSVGGVVVDAAGQPVAGAKVFNEGDAPGLMQTTTDAAGRFKLQGLFEGPVYVFARKPGYRFSMAYTRSGDSAVKIRMLNAGALAPAAEQPNPRPPAYVAAEKKLTRHLLERLWALPRHVTDGYENQVLEAMAAIDLAQAKKWLAEEEKREPSKPHTRMIKAIHVAEAEKAAAGDPDEAVALLSSLQPQPAFEALLHLAERFAKEDPGKAARFMAEAVVRARAVKLPERASALAQSGDLAIRLGQSAAGRKLLTEAADLAEQFGTERRQGFARAKVAELLAPVDLARSRSLLKGFPDRENDIDGKYRLGWVAVKLASTHLHQALALLEGIQPGSTFVREESRLKIAYLLAEKDPAEAVKQAETIAEPRYRAAALSGVAMLVSRRDPVLSRSLIDRVMDEYLDRPDEFSSWSGFGGRTALAAWTAYHARLAGYPDMASVVARVLACRPTNPPFDVSHILLHTAIPVSFTDPVTARRLVEQALPEDKAVQSSQLRSREALFAAALADPERAMRLIDGVIDETAKSKDGLRGTSLIELMMTLAAPSENLRVRQLNVWIGQSWTPGTEDYP